MAPASSIRLSDYDPAWVSLFEREACRVRAALGPLVIQLEHAGSTSVPGLVAKPVIDILLVVADSADEHSYVPGLESAGYVLRIREADWYQHRMFNGPDTATNLHVFSIGCPEIAKLLAFRDRLRTDAADRELYAQAKLSLAKKSWNDVQEYADAKTSVIEEIVARARRHPA